MRFADYLDTLPEPVTLGDIRQRSALEHLLAGLEADVGGPVNLARARWPVVADRLLNAGHAELSRISAALRSGVAVRDLFDPTPSGATSLSSSPAPDSTE